VAAEPRPGVEATTVQFAASSIGQLDADSCCVRTLVLRQHLFGLEGGEYGGKFREKSSGAYVRRISDQEVVLGLQPHC
jgi:hypothetical protein